MEQSPRNGFAAPRVVTDEGQCFFYHVTDLPGGGTVGGHWDLRKTVGAYLGEFDFGGKNVLDVGTASGYLTFEMEKRGASVVSFDQGHPDTSEFVPFVNDPMSRSEVIQAQIGGLEQLKNSYWYMHRRLNSKARAYYGNVYELPEALGTFDVVMIGMILPHLRDPMRALEACANRSRDTVIVTQQSVADWLPTMRLMPDPETTNIANMRFAWWMMSDGLIVNFMKIMGFKLQSMSKTDHLCVAYDPARMESCTSYVFRRQ